MKATITTQHTTYAQIAYELGKVSDKTLFGMQIRLGLARDLKQIVSDIYQQFGDNPRLTTEIVGERCINLIKKVI